MCVRAFVCMRECETRLPLTDTGVLFPRLLTPPPHLSPRAERGLISQLSTHFLRLSPSRSHTLLLLLPSVPFSIFAPSLHYAALSISHFAALGLSHDSGAFHLVTVSISALLCIGMTRTALH